jgi:hypothetical protein
MSIRLPLAAALLVLSVALVHAEEAARSQDLLHRPTQPKGPTGETREPNQFSISRPHGPGTDKARALQREAAQLQGRAAALGVRAEELWDEGKYDESDALEEQAQDLISQEHRLEARAKAIQLNPGIPEPQLSTVEDVQ